jgi:hypothetical protein
MAGAHMFQAVQHPEVNTLDPVAIRDFLKKGARYLRLVAQDSKADKVNVTPITVVASIDPKLLENLINMKKVDADPVDDCADESVMEYLESTQDRDAFVTAKFVKAEVLAKLAFAMSEKEPALRVTKAVADYNSLHSNLKLDFISGKPRKGVENLMSVIRPANLKSLIKIKLEMNESDLKKDFLEFVAYLEKMDIILDEHVVDHKKTGDSDTKNMAKNSDAGGRSAGYNPGGRFSNGDSNMTSDRDRTKSGTGRSSDSSGTGKQSMRDPLPCLNARSVRAKRVTCPTVLTLRRTKILSCWPSTMGRKMQTRIRQTSKIWAATKRFRTTEIDRTHISRRRTLDSRS